MKKTLYYGVVTTRDFGEKVYVTKGKKLCVIEVQNGCFTTTKKVGDPIHLSHYYYIGSILQNSDKLIIITAIIFGDNSLTFEYETVDSKTSEV
jgi:hypothetical protein